jgi:hypothetical protein
MGHKLSRALAWLHRHNVLHRDISPRNVILSEPDLDPVLIDFGLAHTAHTPMGTRVASEFAAPEVTCATPRWSRAADVWSLCRTLAVVVQKSERIGLSGLLAAGMAEDAESRPTADDLVDRFGDVLARLTLADRRAEAWREVEKLVAKDIGSRAYQQVLHKCRAEIENLVLGFHTELYDRCALIADICNQIVEASDRRLSLGKVSGQFVKGAEFLATPEMSTATALRNYRSHGSKNKSDVKTPARELEGHMLAVGKQLADGVGLASIQPLVAKMLGGAGKT